MYTKLINRKKKSTTKAAIWLNPSHQFSIATISSDIQPVQMYEMNMEP
jgi:hypothetical protein